MKKTIIPMLLTAALLTGCGSSTAAEAQQEHPLFATETPRVAIVTSASVPGRKWSSASVRQL